MKCNTCGSDNMRVIRREEDERIIVNGTPQRIDVYQCQDCANIQKERV